MNVAHALIHTWEKIGIKYAFGIPGEETLELVEALRNSNIEFIITRHEEGAAFMAATVGRLTGYPCLCITTLGPGAINAFTPLAYAKLGQMPLILLSSQKPVRTIKQGDFQLVDILSMTRPLSYFSQSLVNDAAAVPLAMEAYHEAMLKRGPTHIELPEDIAEETVPEHTLNVHYPETYRPYANHEALKKAVEMIERSSSPLLIFGQNANNTHTSKALTEFINLTRIPFVTTQMGKGAVDETRSEFIGTPAVSSNDIIHEAIRQSDLLIMVGHNHAEKPPFMACCGLQKIIHIDDHPAYFNEVYIPCRQVIGDIAATFYSLNKKLTPSKSWGEKNFQAVKRAFEKHENQLSKSGKFKPFHIVKQVENAMPDNGIVLLDNGMYKIWFARHYRAKRPNTLILDNALATMGAGLPSGIAAALIHPQTPILSVCGDGGFMMSVQELETATRLKINLVILVLRDNAFGMIRWKQHNQGFSEHAVKFHNPDFVKLAESFGAIGTRVEDISDLAKTIIDANQEGGVHLIEVPIDYADNGILSHLKEISLEALTDEQ